ncbi:MAG: hypothetical protein ACI4JY_11090 [Oscillospiraceae bacterium]
MVLCTQGKEAEDKPGSRYGDQPKFTKGESLRWVAEFEAAGKAIENVTKP